MMNQTQKHTTGKKLLALLLALIMTVSLLPVSVFAAEVEAEPEQAVIDLVGDSQSENGDNLNTDDSAGSDADLVKPSADAAADQNAENGIAPLADDGVTGVTTVIACSDFQNPSGDDAGKDVVTSILTAMKNDGIAVADGFICAGDYSYDYSDDADTLKGHLTALKSAVEGVYTTIPNQFYVQGNHDQVTQGTGGLTGSGEHDAANYGVYVLLACRLMD